MEDPEARRSMPGQIEASTKVGGGSNRLICKSLGRAGYRGESPIELGNSRFMKLLVGRRP